MQIMELATYCKENEIDCNTCKYALQCRLLLSKLEDISPIGLVEFIQNNGKIEDL